MASLPRLRQLRRNPDLFDTAVAALILSDATAQLIVAQPELEIAPNYQVNRLQEGGARWIDAGQRHIQALYRCTEAQAVHLMRSLLLSVRDEIPTEELRRLGSVEDLLQPVEGASADEA